MNIYAEGKIDGWTDRETVINIDREKVRHAVGLTEGQIDMTGQSDR